ncbi:MAG: hypothetical protein CL868_07740 [Cytophagaceae bacterium]|nr:hypothetical protein [Cytophagaceae bacterium]|tara:strand:+ start:29631 stop:30095 length:465 start_codon:yes stop_codon:yes gene_type:complete
MIDFVIDATLKNRLALKKYLDDLALDQLNKIPDGFNNNVIWNIAHTVVTQQLIVYKLSGETPMVDDELIASYKKGTKPEVDVSQIEVDDLKKLLFSTIEQTEVDYNNARFKNFKSYSTSVGVTLNDIDQAIFFNMYHEGLHRGYIQALVRAMGL